MDLNSTQRFTDRVVDYVLYRPGYPEQVVDFLYNTCHVPRVAHVADIGAGTGISTKLFLDAGHSVTAVEPNDAMRGAADLWLGPYSGYSSVTGTAERTTLPQGCVDLVIAAQAFHWFDEEKTKKEFSRILRPEGQVALFWNDRKLEGSAFLRDYEALLQRFGTDYSSVAERYATHGQMAKWFGQGSMHSACFSNVQKLDFSNLKGRLLSSSYAPQPGHSNHLSMMKALEDLFEADAEEGYVLFEYETRIYAGCIFV